MLNGVPELSIVMPVFNNADLTRSMIESIRSNDYADWELIAVDDGSDAETLSMLNSLAEADDRIRIITRNRQPKGAQTCRNIGMEQAQGEFLIFFDNDDYVCPHCLRVRVEALKSRTDLDFIVFPTGVLKDNEQYYGSHESAYGYPLYKDDTKAFAMRMLPFVVWNNVYRRTSLVRYGIRWDEHLLSLQDADFNVQTIMNGMRYDYYHGIPDFCYRIGHRTGSVSNKLISTEHKQSTLYAIDKFYSMYAAKYGHRYDFSLFFGVLFLYNKVMERGVDADYAADMVRVVMRHSVVYCMLFSMQVGLSRCLSVVFPPKVSRQIPMLFHLLNYRNKRRKKLKLLNLMLKQ